MRVQRIAMWIAGLALLALTTGCSSDPARKPAFPVHGRLTFEGQPMDKATILFTPAEPNDRSLQPNTTTDSDGRYTLTAYTSNDGAPAGEYIVAILWPAPKGKAKKTDPSEHPDDVSGPDRLKGKYWPVGRSSLRATVKADQENEINFNLP